MLRIRLRWEGLAAHGRLAQWHARQDVTGTWGSICRWALAHAAGCRTCTASCWGSEWPCLCACQDKRGDSRTTFDASSRGKRAAAPGERRVCWQQPLRRSLHASDGTRLAQRWAAREGGRRPRDRAAPAPPLCADLATARTERSSWSSCSCAAPAPPASAHTDDHAASGAASCTVHCITVCGPAARV